MFYGLKTTVLKFHFVEDRVIGMIAKVILSIQKIAKVAIGMIGDLEKKNESHLIY